MNSKIYFSKYDDIWKHKYFHNQHLSNITINRYKLNFQIFLKY